MKTVLKTFMRKHKLRRLRYLYCLIAFDSKVTEDERKRGRVDEITSLVTWIDLGMIWSFLEFHKVKI